MDPSQQERIALDPKVMAGKPVIRGTRIPVELVVRMVAEGVSDEEILREYPRLVSEDIRAALNYAAEVVAGEVPTHTFESARQREPHCSRGFLW